jgi:TonB family protein
VDIAESRDKRESPEEGLVVPIEVLKQQEPLPVEMIPRAKAESQKLPKLPKIEIRSITATDLGAEIEGSVPQLPRTLAPVRDPGADMILRAPGPRERRQQYQDTIPAPDVESALDSSRKPSPEIGPPERVRDGSAQVASEPKYVRDNISSPDERLGPSKDIARPSFAGEITGQIAGRKVVFWPRPPEGYKGTEGGSATIKFWVDPAGNVTRVEISKKSGNPRLDTMAKAYVEGIRFEELPEPVVQYGEIVIDFELIRRRD